VTITASFAAVQLGRAQPRFGDLIGFGLGAGVAFGGLEGLASGGFRVPLEKGPDQVMLLGTALVESLECMFAEWLQERRGEATDPQ
jgi:hypothetical protein